MLETRDRWGIPGELVVRRGLDNAETVVGDRHVTSMSRFLTISFYRDVADDARFRSRVRRFRLHIVAPGYGSLAGPPIGFFTGPGFDSLVLSACPTVQVQATFSRFLVPCAFRVCLIYKILMTNTPETAMSSVLKAFDSTAWSLDHQVLNTDAQMSAYLLSAY